MDSPADFCLLGRKHHHSFKPTLVTSMVFTGELMAIEGGGGRQPRDKHPDLISGGLFLPVRWTMSQAVMRIEATGDSTVPKTVPAT